jgi:hypothetical protein
VDFLCLNSENSGDKCVLIVASWGQIEAEFVLSVRAGHRSLGCHAEFEGRPTCHLRYTGRGRPYQGQEIQEVIVMEVPSELQDKYDLNHVLVIWRVGEREREKERGVS